MAYGERSGLDKLTGQAKLETGVQSLLQLSLPSD